MKMRDNIIYDQLLSPHLETKVNTKNGVVEVSSIHYILMNRRYNETCVFFADNTSEIVGDYTVHHKVVSKILSEDATAFIIKRERNK